MSARIGFALAWRKVETHIVLRFVTCGCRYARCAARADSSIFRHSQVKPADPTFVGFCVNQNADSAVKVVPKSDAEEVCEGVGAGLGLGISVCLGMGAVCGISQRLWTTSATSSVWSRCLRAPTRLPLYCGHFPPTRDKHILMS